MNVDVAAELGAALDTTEMREVRARNAAEIIRAARDYRWVGIYDVGDEEVELVGHTGVQTPAFVHAPIEEGLNGDAVRTRETATSGSETVVPIIGAEVGTVIGTLDVESDRLNALDDGEQRFLEACARALMPLFE